MGKQPMNLWLHMRKAGRIANGQVWRTPFQIAMPPSPVRDIFGTDEDVEYVEIAMTDGSKVRYSKKETR